ncbi:MAG: hypothetical protein HS100_18190 [Anaerolineales bacterium]|nr:hypothetical protein [Anaerolineales bacterium]MCE7861051.1 hypothetical protein [Chloroflexi bacterium CFX2]
MNTIISFLVHVFLTIAVTALVVNYIRPYLRKVLVDLCGTEERAQFWTVFSNVVLVGLPGILALNYRPEAVTLEELFFEIAGRLSGTLAGFLFGLVGVGFVVSIFALFAPRPAKAEAK